MSEITTVVLDLGNVLAFHDNRYLFEQLGARAGLDADEVARRFAERTLFDRIQRGPYDAAGIRREVADALALDIALDDFVPLWCCHFRMNEPVWPLVAALAGKVTLVLLSNTNALHTAYLRPLLPVLRHFDHLVLSNEVGLIKPEPAIYQYALSLAGALPAQTVFFDDHPAYVDAARGLGIQAYVFEHVEGFRARLLDLALLPTT
ncbi:MAG: HAD family phosphatase [Dehalococcoidia bacterium]